MTNGLTSPKATDRPPGPTPQAARGAPPPSDAFAGMLDAHQARTAIAEGHTERPEKPAAPASVDSAPAEQQDQPATDTPDEDTAATSALLAAALPMPIEVAPVATEPVAAAATQMVVAGGAPTPVVQVITPAPAELPAAAALPGASATTATTTTATTTTTAPVTAAPAQAAVASSAAAEAVPAETDKAQAPAVPVPAQPDSAKPATAPASGQPAADGSSDQGQPQPDPKAAQTLQQARAAVAYARPQAESQQTQASQPAAQPAPVTPATSAAPATAPATPMSAATPVPLARAAEAVEHVLRLASSRGVTHARIALNPADLGAVDVHIRSTAEGLVARVVAHSAEAVQTLQHAAGDLRRSLEEQGLNVMSLDIGQPGESGTGRAGSESNGRNKYDGSPAGAESDETTTQTKTLRLPTGVLVDVLA
jgi:flagellar hook-length control protein FliK